MRTLIDKFTKNPYILFVGWLASILGLIIAVVPYVLQVREVGISFSYTTNLLATDTFSEIEGLDINLKGKEIEHLSVTTCRFVNDGSETIEDSDVYEGHKIKIQPIDDNIDIIFASIVAESYDTIGSKIIYDDKSLTFQFDTLEKEDEVVINIYHTGKKYAAFSIDGKIKGGKIILVERWNYRKLLVFAVLNLLIIVLGVYHFLIWWSISFARIPEGNSHRFIYTVLNINFILEILLVFIEAYLIYRILYRIFG